MSIKGYKVINPDWTCRGFKYEVGKTYKHTGTISLCKEGFHFCKKAVDCFNYYSFDSNNHVVEVEALGSIESDDIKSVTDEIRIVREIEWLELLTIVNEGKNCTGYGNAGDWNTGRENVGVGNTGDRNIGKYNTGNYNTGNWNVGKGNTGNCNVGNYNTGSGNIGEKNTGCCNTGNWNVGNWNAGDWNTGHYNTGFFCTDTPKVRAFNVQTNISRSEWLNIEGVQILNLYYQNSWWIFPSDMTDKEKKEHPEYKTTNGYLKTVNFKEACAIMWDKLDEEEKQAVRDIPYFDTKIFKEITGIDAELK